MFNDQMEILMAVFAAIVAEEPTKTWVDAREAIAACGEIEEDVAAVVAAEDAEALRAILAEWHSGKRLLLEHDRGVLKRALKAFRKSMKVTLLADESTLGGSAMSSGRKSTIVGIRPPERYPHETWEELARQGRLKSAGHGNYELPPD